MSYLVDSNILTALSQKYAPQYFFARQSITNLRRQKESIYLVPQILIEYWSVATRPLDVNGLSFDFEKTDFEIRKFRRYLKLIDDLPGLFGEWEKLVRQYKVSGKKIHDARIVAAMMQHGITRLLTFNGKDFRRFREILTVDPHALI